MPTGSGKTLVGLLIAEWKRRKYNEKVVYLCPTKQLVNQVVNEANNKYGMNVVGYTGSARSYSPEQKASYRLNEAVSITTYSSLFNSNPFFKDASLIILDDAHSCENYIGKYWSLLIDRGNSSHKSLHTQISSLIKPYLKPVDQDRLTGKHSLAADISWVDKLPTRIFNLIRDNLHSIIEECVEESDLKYTWGALKDNFHACHVFLSSKEILIRPALFPTWTHNAFSSAQQRLFMSATLGEGGDLERISGRPNIMKIKAPESFKLHGIGRRFFLFPDMSLSPEDCITLSKKLIKKAKRALYLVPSTPHKDAVEKELKKISGLTLFNATDIEKSKIKFEESELAVAVLANRYDGIDFRGEACRLLFIEGLPRAMNLNERFLMDKMAASIIFNERIQTRIIQAVGRCTRSLEDYSAVVVLGDDIPDYLVNELNTKYLHPNLQAELKFGKKQSYQVNIDDFVDNISIFLDQGSEWQEVNDDINNVRKNIDKENFPSIELLQSSVNHEIQYQKLMWSGDYSAALIKAEKVLGSINGPSKLKGYRAWWHYLAGSAGELASGEDSSYSSIAEDHFREARKAAPTLQWLVPLCKITENPNKVSRTAPACDLNQISNFEQILTHIGARNHSAFEAKIKEIRKEIFSNDAKKFERGLKGFGELLGFSSFNDESDGAPDGWWLSDDQCIVFEAHSDSDGNTVLGSKKARQVESHPKWLVENKFVEENVSIISVLITPSVEMKKEAHALLGGSFYWEIESFRDWVSGAIAVVQIVRKNFDKPGDLVWQSEALTKLTEHDIIMSELVAHISTRPAKKLLKPV